MDIIEAVLHGVSKEQGTSGPGSTAERVREHSLPVNPILTRTADNLRGIYAATRAQGYGIFSADEDTHAFPRKLGEFRAGTCTFLDLSKIALAAIADRMSAQPFATGGYALFLHYADFGREWVMVAMLKLRPGTSVNDETLELTETVNLDLDHLHEAARIDLTKWADNQQPYLSFIRTRASQDVSHYFRYALGCTDYTDSKHDTETVQTALENFCDKKQWNREQKQAAKKTFVEICEARNSAGDPVNLVSLSAAIATEEPEAFVNFVRNGDYPVSDVFQPAKSVYSKWRRIRKSFGSVTIAFDIQDVELGRVDYDDDHGYLVIRDPPQDLVGQILENRSGHDDS